MGRVLWAWCFSWLVLVGLTAIARADDFAIIRVCVRPSNVPPDVERWARTQSGTLLFTTNPDTFREKTKGLTIFVYDPSAPPESVQLLPIPHNQLKCAPYKPPAAAPVPPPPPPAAGPPPPGSGAKGGDASKSGKDKPATADKDEPPPDLPKPIVYPKNDPEPRPQPPANGVTTHWPKSVLPFKRTQILPSTKVLPTAHVLPSKKEPVDTPTEALPHKHILPFKRILPYKHEVEKLAQSGKGDGGKTDGGKGDGGKGEGGKSDAPIKVAEKTFGDKFAEQLIFAGMILNGELNHNIKGPDGKQYGMPGGKNPDGPNTPEAQAGVGVVASVIAVLSAGASSFYKKLAKALRDGKPLVYSEMKNVGDGVADELAEKLGEHFKNQLGKDAVGRTRIALAASLNKNGAIGPYSKMTQFTDNLGGSYQAHHILEEQMIRRFKLGKPDLGPSVILTSAEHKAITAQLKVETAGVETVQELWQAYQKVYKKYPHWLDAIKPYFVKGK